MKRFSKGKQDYYSILQIGYTASAEDIRSAYKRQAFLTHPDRSKHPHANQQMQLLNEAYEVLSNPKKKACYDQERLAATAIVPVETPVPVHQPTQEIRKDWKDLERKRRRLMRKQLIIMTYLILVTIGMFFWFLASGEVNFYMILLIVMLAVLSLASMIFRVRNPDG
jgi:hypothetical protein